MNNILQTTFSKVFSWQKILNLSNISLIFVPQVPVDSKLTLIQEKPLTEPMMIQFNIW